MVQNDNRVCQTKVSLFIKVLFRRPKSILKKPFLFRNRLLFCRTFRITLILRVKAEGVTTLLSNQTLFIQFSSIPLLHSSKNPIFSVASPSLENHVGHEGV